MLQLISLHRHDCTYCLPVRQQSYNAPMTIILILLLALVLGGFGLFVEGLKWLLVIALILLIVGALSGNRY